MNWKLFGKIHQRLYRWSGGRLGARMGWIDVALVDTVVGNTNLIASGTCVISSRWEVPSASPSS